MTFVNGDLKNEKNERAMHEKIGGRAFLWEEQQQQRRETAHGLTDVVKEQKG